ncbi:MAG: hypothetical protein M3068_13935 [Gemmatimonadota bacterium]|nr:hypothetical protein [Gemmatimonadota bacterium]
MADFLERPVFAVAGDPFAWYEVLLASSRWGDHASLEREIREGLAVERWADDQEQGPSAEAVAAAAAAFRYERQLVTAREMREWLQALSLSLTEWSGYIRRALLRRDHAARLLNLTGTYPATDPEVAAQLLPEGVCSGSLQRTARKLAGRSSAILGHDSTEPEEGNEDADIPISLPIPLAILLEHIDPERLLAAERRLARIDRAFQRFRSETITAGAVRERIGAHHLDWIRFHCRTLFFPDREMAREAVLCLRDDSSALDEISASARVRSEDAHVYLEQIDDLARDRFLGARRGELVGPLDREGAFVVYQIVDKVLPSEQDPEIRRRAEDSVLRSVLTREVEARVAWQHRL